MSMPDRLPENVSPPPSTPAVDVFRATMDDLEAADAFASGKMFPDSTAIALVGLLRLALWRFEFDYGAGWDLSAKPLADPAADSDNPG